MDIPFFSNGYDIGTTIGAIVFLGILVIAILGLIIAFILGVVSQKRYDNEQLPTLDLEKEVVPEPEPSFFDEELAESAFSMDDPQDAHVPGDEDSDALLADVRAAESRSSLRKDRKRSLFGKK